MFLDQNLENGLVFTRNERARLKNAILKNITVKADKLANEYNKTKDPGIKDQWYATIKEAIKYKPEEEEEGNRINFKRKN